MQPLCARLTRAAKQSQSSHHNSDFEYLREANRIATAMIDRPIKNPLTPLIMGPWSGTLVDADSVIVTAEKAFVIAVLSGESSDAEAKVVSEKFESELIEVWSVQRTGAVL